MMENKLEEIRKRAAEYDPDDPPDNYVFHMMACSDRRWLLGEVERLREALEFYAKFDHYTNVQDLSQDWPHQIIQAPIIVDGGKKARRVLGWEE